MPSFKPKTNKKLKYNKKSSVTLDGKHKEFINEFSKNDTYTIPELKNEKIELIKLQKEGEYSLTVEQKLDITDRINEINSTIKELKNTKKDYFLNNSKFIFDYFENKLSISSGITTNTNKTQILNNFFKIKEDDIENKIFLNKNNNIVQKYLSNNDDNFIDVNNFVCQTDICQYCFKGELPEIYLI